MNNADYPIQPLPAVKMVTPADDQDFIKQCRPMIGLTKREDMAGRLMQAIVGRSDCPAPRWAECARDAVIAADALLEELERQK